MRTLLASLSALAVAGCAAGFGAASTGRPNASAPAAAQASGTLTVRKSTYGRVLFDGRGKALYAFTRDPKGGKSRCYGACAAAWPVYFAKGRLRAGKGVRPKLIGTTLRRDGKRQVTYNGRPLYYYVNDRRVGQIGCQNVAEFGGTWLVVRPNGHLVR
jgi:predicted lipoprotein with Yx(FWY)xxD motif